MGPSAVPPSFFGNTPAGVPRRQYTMPSAEAGDDLPRPVYHAASGQYRVRLSGIDVYLGRAGSPDIQAKYERALGDWLARGRRFPYSRPGRHEPVNLDNLARRYQDWGEAYYRKNGVPTRTFANLKNALQILRGAVDVTRPAVAFDVSHLKAMRRAMAVPDELGRLHYSRSTINEYVRHVVAMFRWGVEESLVDPDTYAKLAAVRPLARGRPVAEGLGAAPEGRVRSTVKAADIEAVRAQTTSIVRAMIDVQLLTGMRPNELCRMRGEHLEPSINPSVVLYRVPAEANKTDHAGRARTVYLGPKAWAIIRPLLSTDPKAYVFRPMDAFAEAAEARSRRRRSPRWPSHSSEARRQRRGAGAVTVTDHYRPDSYRRAIERACARAQIKPWTPYQLRHNAITEAVQTHDILTAKSLAGHADIATTMRYVHLTDAAAILAAMKSG